jgi:hypothetical protein
MISNQTPVIQNFEPIAVQEEEGSNEGGQVPLENEAERARFLLLFPFEPLPLPGMEACGSARQWRRTPEAIAKSRLELDAMLALRGCACACGGGATITSLAVSRRPREPEIGRSVSECRVDVYHKTHMGWARCWEVEPTGE